MHIEDMPRVKKAVYLKDYKILVFFTDGTIKLVDFKHRLRGEVFEPLKDLSYFKQFKIYRPGKTLCWPNGADICPDVLYKIGKDLDRL